MVMRLFKQEDSPYLGSIVTLSLLGHEGLLSYLLGPQSYEQCLSHKDRKKENNRLDDGEKRELNEKWMKKSRK